MMMAEMRLLSLMPVLVPISTTTPSKTPWAGCRRPISTAWYSSTPGSTPTNGSTSSRQSRWSVQVWSWTRSDILARIHQHGSAGSYAVWKSMEFDLSHFQVWISMETQIFFPYSHFFFPDYCPNSVFLKYEIQFQKNKSIMQAVFCMGFGAASTAKMFTTVRGRRSEIARASEWASFSWTQWMKKAAITQWKLHYLTFFNSFSVLVIKETIK